MGVYTYYQMYNNRPAYQAPNGRRLYFANSNSWLIGPSLGAPTGKSLSEALVFASTNSQYDDRLFIELQVQ